jgi:hypothetical protein
MHVGGWLAGFFPGDRLIAGISFLIVNVGMIAGNLRLFLGSRCGEISGAQVGGGTPPRPFSVPTGCFFFSKEPILSGWTSKLFPA